LQAVNLNWVKIFALFAMRAPFSALQKALKKQAE